MDLKQQLNIKPEFQKHLFERGFLISDHELSCSLSKYPFFGNWNSAKYGDYYFYTYQTLDSYMKEANGIVLFLLGHAYNPFDMDDDENSILEKLIKLKDDDFWRYEADLTGVYVMGKITADGQITHWSDCAGMRISYYGFANEHYYITSHVNIVASLTDLTENNYVKELKSNHYFQLFGNILPGDLSIYNELKRTVPNHTYCNTGEVKRFYPIESIRECESEEDYQTVLIESARILKNTLELCAKKWKDSSVAISVTGGKDSGETLASANGHYDSFLYFSYISKPEEEVDAKAAAEICRNLGLKHRLIPIPENVCSDEEFELFSELVYINGGSIGYIKPNEIRKRIVLVQDKTIDIEIKSWVNETVRAYWYKKYNKKAFPAKPTGKYLATLYKVFIENRKLFKETSKVFDEYIDRYMNDDDTSVVNDWTTLWSWEFGFSAGEGQSLFAEHVLSFDITIPYNNRHLISLMLRPKISDRINDRLQKDIIEFNNPKQASLHIDVVNAAHTDKRALMERAYLFINTHLPY